MVAGGLNLLDETQQQNLWTRTRPVVLQMLLGLRSDAIVCRLQGLEELVELGVDVGREEGHGRDGLWATAPCSLFWGAVLLADCLGVSE